MEQELKDALEAHETVNQVLNGLYRDDSAPKSVVGYVWRVRHHLSERVGEVTLRFGS